MIVGALVDELIEAVLAVRAGLAPVERARVVVDHFAVKRHVLAVGLHSELLEVSGSRLRYCS